MDVLKHLEYLGVMSQLGLESSPFQLRKYTEITILFNAFNEEHLELEFGLLLELTGI